MYILTDRMGRMHEKVNVTKFLMWYQVHTSKSYSYRKTNMIWSIRQKEMKNKSMESLQGQNSTDQATAGGMQFTQQWAYEAITYCLRIKLN